MIRLGGIKFSEELVQITVNQTTPSDSAIQDLLGHIRAQKINIPFLCYADEQDNSCSSTVFCVSVSDFDAVQQLLNLNTLQLSSFSIIESVGTITTFPHRNSYEVIGKIVTILGQHNHPIYSLSTSISALALNTAFSQLDDIVLLLLKHDFELPENHAPFRPEFQLKELSE